MEKFPPNFMKVFSDMDGVLTDWNQAVKDLVGYSIEWNDPEDKKNKVYKAIDDAGPEFWSEMSWMPDGKKLWGILTPFRPVLLSSPGKFRYAEQGKREWVSKNVPGTALILEIDKFKYAERDAVLIDDMKDNIGAWKESGGIGILHTSVEETEIQLLSLLSPKES